MEALDEIYVLCFPRVKHKGEGFRSAELNTTFLFLVHLWGVYRNREFLKTDAAVWFTVAADWTDSVNLNPLSGNVFKHRWNSHLFRKALRHIPIGQHWVLLTSGIWVCVAAPYWNRGVTQSRTWRLIFPEDDKIVWNWLVFDQALSLGGSPKTVFLEITCFVAFAYSQRYSGKSPVIKDYFGSIFPC